MASDIDDFADEEEAGDAAGFHGFARELARVHSAGGDFGFFVAFGGGGDESPGVELLFESSERGIGVSARGMKFEPPRGEALGEKFLKRVAGSGEIAAAGYAKCSGRLALGSEIETDGLTLLPVGRDLKNGRAAEAAMGEEHSFAEGMFPSGGDDVSGNSSEFGIAMLVGAMENEGNERGASGNDFMSELAGEVVAEGSSAHLGDGEATGGHDKSRSAKFS